MGATRRKFTLEFRIEAAHRVIDTGRSVREVANELSVLESSLSKWVRDERRRLDAVAGTSEEPLTPAERAELLLRILRVFVHPFRLNLYTRSGVFVHPGRS
jgi:transposase